jgi:hypothetical protein
VPSSAPTPSLATPSDAVVSSSTSASSVQMSTFFGHRCSSSTADMPARPPESGVAVHHWCVPSKHDPLHYRGLRNFHRPRKKNKGPPGQSGTGTDDVRWLPIDTVPAQLPTAQNKTKKQVAHQRSDRAEKTEASNRAFPGVERAPRSRQADPDRLPKSGSLELLRASSTAYLYFG